MKKRLSALLLALLMLLSLVGCGGESGGKGEPVTVADAGSTEYTIIYPAGASLEVMNTVTYLQKALKDLTGVDFAASEDMAISAKAESKEILVAGTDRDESAAAMDSMSSSGDFTVKVSGSKIVLAGMLDMGVQEAAERLIADLTASGSLTLEGGYAVNGTSDSAVQYLPVFSYGVLETSYDCGDGADMLIYNADEAGFTSYQADLEKAGFTKYTDNAIGTNKFATYTKDNVMVHMMSLPAMENVRIIAMTDAVLPEVEAPQVTAKVQPSITQLGLEGYDTDGSANQIGMSLLYQLSDGSFFVVDGGHNLDQAADQLYNTMKALAPDANNIHIRAWMITHAHVDHMGAVRKFAEKYAGQVQVDQLLWNLPNDVEMNGGSESEAKNRTRIRDAAEKLGATTAKVFSGQVWYIGDAVVEILCGVDLVAPQSFEDYNNSSIICSVELGGQKMMQLADCGPLQSPILTSLYGTELKSDIVQNGHHGYRGATSELYRAINPDYMFWPGGSRAFENYKDMDYNTWVVGHVKQNWVALDQVITKTLPIAE